MNVKELIEALSQYPEDANVYIWGIDNHTEAPDYIDDFKVSYDEMCGKECIILD